MTSSTSNKVNPDQGSPAAPIGSKMVLGLLVGFLVGVIVVGVPFIVLYAIEVGHDDSLPVPSPSPPPIGCTKRIYIVRHGEKIYHAGDILTSGAECLNQKGWARAYHLKSLFDGEPYHRPDAIFSADYNDSSVITGGAFENCRDEHGWYRTTQLVKPLAQDAPGGLDLEVNNRTGYMPQLCGLNGVAPFSKCSSAGLYPNLVAENGTCCPFGFTSDAVSADERLELSMCCNPHAAAVMKAKLAEPGVCTLLVAWESKNIEFLTAALGVPGGEAWYTDDPTQDNYEYDHIYMLEFDDALNFVELVKLKQGFGTEGTRSPECPDGCDNWLGPKEGCGAIEPS